MQHQERVIKSFENELTKKDFYKNLRGIISKWFQLVAWLIVVLLFLFFVVYFLVDAQASIWTFLKFSLGAFILFGLAFLWSIISFVAENEMKFVIDFTETHLMVYKYYSFFKRTFSLSYQTIKYMQVFSGESFDSTTIYYELEDEQSELSIDYLIPLDFWRVWAQTHQVILVLQIITIVPDEQDDTIDWYLREINFGPAHEPIQWVDFQRYIQATPGIEQVSSTQIENYSTMSDDRANNYGIFRYKFHFNPTTQGYLYYNAGFVSVFLPPINGSDVTERIYEALLPYLKKQ